MLRTPEITMSTTVASDTSWGGCGHGHAMAGGERFSGKVVGLAREGGGARGPANRRRGASAAGDLGGEDDDRTRGGRTAPGRQAAVGARAGEGPARA